MELYTIIYKELVNIVPSGMLTYEPAQADKKYLFAICNDVLKLYKPIKDKRLNNGYKLQAIAQSLRPDEFLNQVRKLFV